MTTASTATARRDFTIALLACTLVSLAGNEASSTMLARDLGLPIPVVMVAGAIAPLLLPAAVHLVPRTVGLPQKARRVVIFAVLVAAAAAFALSFASLTAVAQASGHPGKLGMLLPIAVDVLAAASAYALVVMPADAPATEQSVQTPVHQPEQAHAPAYPDALTRLAPVHQPDEPRTADRPAEPVDQVADLPVDQTASAVDQPEPQVVHTPVDQTLDHLVNRDDAVTEPLSGQAADRPHEPVSRHSSAEVDRDPEPVNRRSLALVDQPANHRAIAEQVAARTAGDWTVDQLERVSRSTPGLGQRALADELGVSPTTVNRMRKAIAQAAADSDNAEEAEPEPALA